MMCVKQNHENFNILNFSLKNHDILFKKIIFFNYTNKKIKKDYGSTHFSKGTVIPDRVITFFVRKAQKLIHIVRQLRNHVQCVQKFCSDYLNLVIFEVFGAKFRPKNRFFKIFFPRFRKWQNNTG